MSAKVFSHLALDLVSVGNDLVERAILHNQRSGFLGANSRNARNVVGRISLKAIEIWNKLWRNTCIEIRHSLWRHN